MSGQTLNPAINTNSEPETIETLQGKLSTNELFLFNKINLIREENNLNKLEFDESVQEIAKLKATDLANNNYFSHTSPTYGNLNNMLENYKIPFIKSSENIAGNKSIEKAISDWTNSESNNNVILNKEYTHTGVSIVDSKQYGKIIVQIFITKK